jgi:chemotaxis protein methyltransferase CheR
MQPKQHKSARDKAFFVKTFTLKPKEFEAIRVLVKEKTGISLGLHKKDLVVSRLAQRLRRLNLVTFDQYLEYLHNDESGDELVNMINRITTNKTEFFREKHHFDFLYNSLLPSLYDAGEAAKKRRLRIWSAGCSSGEEPYSIAIVINEFFKNRPNWDVKILASDLDTSMLQKASLGVYEESLLEPVPRAQLTRYFSRVKQDGQIRYQVKPDLRELITFRRFNLMRPEYPLKVELDFLFCRNVLIYFDNDDKVDILTKFHSVMAPKAHIFVGHSESLMMVKHLFDYVATTVYRKN